MPAPIAKKIPKKLSIHNDTRIDNYYWLNNREDKEVIDYLKKENEYTQTQLKETRKLQVKLFKEIRGRIKEDDQSVPYFKNGYWYYSRFEEGNEYPVFCRKKESLDKKEEVILNVNELAKGYDFYQVAGLTISPNNRYLIYGVDTLSRRKYDLFVKDLQEGINLDIKIENTGGGSTWAADNKNFFYTRKDEQTLRTHQIYRYDVEKKSETLVFEEQDETFNSYVGKTKDGKYLIIGSNSTLTSEMQYLDANNPLGNFQIFQKRTRGLEYFINHWRDQWLITTNLDAQNFRLMHCKEAQTQKEHWKEEIEHRPNTLLEGLEVFNNFWVLSERTEGLTQLRVLNKESGEDYLVPVQDEAFEISDGINPEMETSKLRYNYTSLTTPNSVYDFDMVSKERSLKKRQEIVGGYKPEDYKSERITVRARDGQEIPVSIVYKKSLKKEKNPLLLYGYGSYGYSMDPYFSSVRLSLLDRGFIYAIAHIRGGEELGRQWYEDGKLLKKKNTFFDFIDCAEHLIQSGYTDISQLFAMGGSAGGLLMGAVLNMRPDLWKGVIAAVPFVDVVTTMLDERIPLTTGEFDEWGNPKEKKFYDYIKSYSPYDNVESKEYPNLLVTTGLHDSQVQYWEPAKWVAKLRDLKTDNNLLLLHTDMQTGHGGASGRFERLKEVAMEYAFLLHLVRIPD